jgi:hypothetical protein
MTNIDNSGISDQHLTAIVKDMSAIKLEDLELEVGDKVKWSGTYSPSLNYVVLDVCHDSITIAWAKPVATPNAVITGYFAVPRYELKKLNKFMTVPAAWIEAVKVGA